ncbi:DNA-binding response regulator [Pontibacter sp. SGAir0037]|nr:DNA-binding response regulator [Pontibacter sp. SGAir0037]
MLADDHTIVRNGIRSLLEEVDDIVIVGEAENGQEAIAKVKELTPNVLMIDIAMPVMTGIEATEQVSRQFGHTKVLVLSMHNNEDYILKSVEAGASGYLLKDTSREEMLRAVRTVAKGEKYFSPAVSGIIVDSYMHKMKGPEKVMERTSKLSKQEKVILRFIVEGCNSREIAEKLNLSVRTIDNHRASMMKRLSVKNAVELVKKALEQNLVE